MDVNGAAKRYDGDPFNPVRFLCGVRPPVPRFNHVNVPHLKVVMTDAVVKTIEDWETAPGAEKIWLEAWTQICDGLYTGPEFC